MNAPALQSPLLWGDKRFHTWNYEMREVNLTIRFSK